MGDGWFNFYFGGASPPSRLDEWAKIAATASPFIAILSVVLTYRIARRVQVTGREAGRRDVTRSLGTEWNSDRINTARKSVIEMLSRETPWSMLSTGDQSNVVTVLGFMKDTLLQIEPRQLCDLATLPAFLPGMDNLVKRIHGETNWLDNNEFFAEIVRIKAIVDNMYTRPRIKLIPWWTRSILFFPAGQLSVPRTFNARFYLRNYPDVAKSSFRAFDHYRIYGGLEHRHPRAGLNKEDVVSEHSKIITAWIARKKSAPLLVRWASYFME